MRTLLVEDYDPLRKAIAGRLRQDGFAVDEAADGSEGLWLARENPYALAILDLTLPNVDGMEILNAVRQRKDNAGVIITTARDTVRDRIDGLDAGADDYLVKPFSLDELMARIRVQLRRSHGLRDSVVEVSDLKIDSTRRRVTRGDRALNLTAKEYALLELLALRAGQIVSRADIWEQLYDFAEETDSNVIDVFVNRLRKKMEEGGGSRLLHTKRGLGYVLAELSRVK